MTNFGFEVYNCHYRKNKYSMRGKRRMFAKKMCRLITAALVLSLTLAVSNGQSQPAASAKTKLIVGTKHVPPFAIKDASGSWSGISIELWRQIRPMISRKLFIPFHRRIKQSGSMRT